MAWTTPKTWNVGDILTASDMNTYTRDNFKYLHGDSGLISLLSECQSALFTCGSASAVAAAAAIINASANIIEISSYDSSTITTINGLSGSGFLLIRNTTGLTINFTTGSNVAAAYTIGATNPTHSLWYKDARTALYYKII